MTTLPALALAFALAQVPAGAPPRDTNAPPAGPSADQQLWRDLRDATNGAILHHARIGQCAYRISYGKYYQALDAVIADEAAPDRGPARALRQRLEAEATAAQAAVPEKPGTRECQYVLRDLDVSMPLAATDRRAARALREARAEGKRCVARLAPLARSMKDRADALEGTLGEIDAFVRGRGAPALVPASATAPAPEGAAAPAEKRP